jgi:hypothetical protein
MCLLKKTSFNTMIKQGKNIYSLYSYNDSAMKSVYKNFYPEDVYKYRYNI